MEIKIYTKDRIPDAVRFEQGLRKEEDFWGWDIDEAYVSSVEKSFEDPAPCAALSLLACEGGRVVGRIDSSRSSAISAARPMSIWTGSACSRAIAAMASPRP